MREREKDGVGLLWLMGLFLSVFVGVSKILFFLLLSELGNQRLNRRGNQRLSNVF